MIPPRSSLNQGLREIIKTRGSFPMDDAALKLLQSRSSGAPSGNMFR
jgi:hypothetical protein